MMHLPLISQRKEVIESISCLESNILEEIWDLYIKYLFLRG